MRCPSTWQSCGRGHSMVMARVSVPLIAHVIWRPLLDWFLLLWWKSDQKQLEEESSCFRIQLQGYSLSLTEVRAGAQAEMEVETQEEHRSLAPRPTLGYFSSIVQTRLPQDGAPYNSLDCPSDISSWQPRLARALPQLWALSSPNFLSATSLQNITSTSTQNFEDLASHMCFARDT